MDNKIYGRCTTGNIIDAKRKLSSNANMDATKGSKKTQTIVETGMLSIVILFMMINLFLNYKVKILFVGEDYFDNNDSYMGDYADFYNSG